MPDIFSLVLGLATVVLVGSYFGIEVGNVLLHPIDVPTRLEQAGYTKNVFNQLILDEVRHIDFAAGPDYVAADVSEATGGKQISIAGTEISLLQVRLLLAQLQGKIDHEFSGTVIERDGKLVLLLVGNSPDGLRTPFTETANLDDPYTLVKAAARDILFVSDPYVLAKLQFEEDKLTGNFSKSLAMIQDLFARLQPSQYHFLYDLAGRALDLSGQPLQAIAAYRQAIADDSNYAIAYSNMALTMRELEQPAEADKLDQAALQTAPKFYNFFWYWANIYRRVGDNDRCVYNYTRYLHYAQTDARAYYDMSTCLRVLGHADEAETALARAVALDPNLAALSLPPATAAQRATVH